MDLAPQLVRDAGMEIENIHFPIEDANELWSPDSRTRRRFIDRHRRWIDICAAHGVGDMVIHITHRKDAPPMAPHGLESFGKVVQHAEQANVRLCLENTRRDDVLSALLELYDHPSVTLCYDSSHDWMWSSSKPLRLLRYFGNRLGQTHLSDTLHDKHRHELPGDGDIDWDALAENFPRNYDGRLTLEVIPSYNRPSDPRQLLGKAYRRAEWLAELLTGRGDGTE